MKMIGRNTLFGGLCAALVLSGAHSAFAEASIEGKVILPDPEVSTGPPPRYAGQVGEIARADPPVAVVYLEGRFPVTATNSTAGTNEVWQRGMQFRPSVLPVRVGTAVAFPNGDDFYHNVFSYSKPKRFDLGRYRKEDKPAIQVFDKPGIVKLYCEIHQHMRGVIVVLDTPYFTRTETNGTYRLSDLPPGKYILKAWADEQRTAEKPVELVPGETLHVDFDLKKER